MANLVCCDTSFLFSLYGRDANTPRAAAAVKHAAQPFSLTAFNEYELLNAIHLSVFRQLFTSAMGASLIAAYTSDLASGNIVIENCNLAQVVAEAKRISATHTAASGYRAFDILHVAAALHLAADDFFTFDVSQRKLAHAAGLKVLP